MYGFSMAPIPSLYGIAEVVARGFRPCATCNMYWAPDIGMFDALLHPCRACGEQIDKLVLEAEANVRFIS